MRLCLLVFTAFAAIPVACAQQSGVLTPAQHYEASVQLRQAAADAVEAGDIPAAIASFESALVHQPGHGSIFVNLAILSARTDDFSAAQKWLTDLNRLGLSYPASALAGAFTDAAAEELAPTIEEIEQNGAPTGTAETVIAVPYPDLLMESAAEIDGTWYVSGIAEPGLYRLGEEAPGNLLGDKNTGSVFEIIAADSLIWAATAIVPQTAENHRNAASALLAVDPKTAEIVHRFEAPADDAQITDLALAGHNVFFTDQAGGAIYRANSETETVDPVVSPGTFASLQGITVSNGALYAADYATGIWQVDLASGDVQRLTTDRASLIGIDGLTADGNGGLIAVRNGARPHGVLHLMLSADGTAIETVTSLATGMPEFDDPTLGFVRDGRFIFIANSQWPSFAEDGTAPNEPRKPVLIMATPLPEQRR